MTVDRVAMIALVGLAGCLDFSALPGRYTGDGGAMGFAATPASLTLAVGRTFTFAANEPADWTIEEGASGGVIDEGLYTAPSTPGHYHVVATSKQMPDHSMRIDVDVEPL